MRQTKKQWCKTWIGMFGKPELCGEFYEYIGGKGKKPNMMDKKQHRKIVRKTILFLEKQQLLQKEKDLVESL